MVSQARLPEFTITSGTFCQRIKSHLLYDQPQTFSCSLSATTQNYLVCSPVTASNSLNTFKDKVLFCPVTISCSRRLIVSVLKSLLIGKAQKCREPSRLQPWRLRCSRPEKCSKGIRCSSSHVLRIKLGIKGSFRAMITNPVTGNLRSNRVQFPLQSSTSAPEEWSTSTARSAWSDQGQNYILHMSRYRASDHYLTSTVILVCMHVG